MNRMRRLVVTMLAAVMIVGWCIPCRAADSTFKEIFEDAFYGGLTGAIVGGALLAFTHKPKDHLDYLYYGAAGGVLVGAGFGLVKSSRALAEYDNGRVRFAIPTITPDIQDTNSKGQTPVVIMAQFIRGRF